MAIAMLFLLLVAATLPNLGFPQNPRRLPVGDPEEGPVEDPEGWSKGDPEEGPVEDPEGWSKGDPQEGPVEDPEGWSKGDPQEGPVEDPEGWSKGDPQEGPVEDPEGWSKGDPQEGPVEDPEDDFFDGRTGPPLVRRFGGPMGPLLQRPGRFGEDFGREPWEDMEDTDMGDRLTGMKRRLDYGVQYWLQLLRQLCTSYWGLAEVKDAEEVEEMKLAEECERWLAGDEAWGNGVPSLDMMQLIFSNKRVVDKLREMTSEMKY